MIRLERKGNDYKLSLGLLAEENLCMLFLLFFIFIIFPDKYS